MMMSENYATTIRPNYHHYPDYAHSDGGSVTPPPSPSSSSSIVSLTNSSTSSSNDNISYYILDSQNNKCKSNSGSSNSSGGKAHNSKKSASNLQQVQQNNSTLVGATKQQTNTDEAVDTELSNKFNCNLLINGDASSNELTRSTLSLADEDVDDVINDDNEIVVAAEDGKEDDVGDDELENEYVERKIKKAEEYEQSQQQLQQQQLDQQRLAVLSFEQVSKLNEVMNEHVSIHGRGNFPTLEVRLKDFVTLVREKLELDIQKGGAGMCVKDIRLNGGAASHVLAYEAQSYNDLDLIFAVEFSSNRHFDRVKSAVLSTLNDLLPDNGMRKRITPGSLREAYVGKMVKVNNDGDRWSLISLGNSLGHKNVELKFVDTMRRQFEFSVDSFQIVLDSLLLFYDCAELPISENFYPTVVGESVYGDFHEALYHLQNKLISTRQPEEIRGGGLLKYCNLLVRNYIPVDAKQIKKLERYMCSRFFIDFPDILQQRIKLEAYLRNHFWGVDEEPLQYHYLVHLHEVVENSTVCLMGHERRQTLNLIEHLALQVSCRERQKLQQQQTHIPAQTLLLSPSSASSSHHQSPQSSQHQQQQQQHLPLTQPQQSQPSQVAISSHPQAIPQYQAADTSQGMPPTQTMHLQVTSQQPTVATQPITATTTSTATPQQIQLQPTNQPGLLYANGVYYAPVTICTCGNQSQYLLSSTWCEDVPSHATGQQNQQQPYIQQQDLISNHNNSNVNNNDKNINNVNTHNACKSYTMTKLSFSSETQMHSKKSSLPMLQLRQNQSTVAGKDGKQRNCTNNKLTYPHDSNTKKKHIKFARSTKCSPNVGAVSKKFPRQKFSKSVGSQKMVTVAENDANSEENAAYYYYYYYPTEETATNDEQSYYYINNNHVAGSFYYYAIDSSLDANYNEYLNQSSSNIENYNLQQHLTEYNITGSRWF